MATWRQSPLSFDFWFVEQSHFNISLYNSLPRVVSWTSLDDTRVITRNQSQSWFRPSAQQPPSGVLFLSGTWHCWCPKAFPSGAVIPRSFCFIIPEPVSSLSFKLPSRLLVREIQQPQMGRTPAVNAPLCWTQQLCDWASVLSVQAKQLEMLWPAITLLRCRFPDAEMFLCFH